MKVSKSVLEGPKRIFAFRVVAKCLTFPLPSVRISLLVWPANVPIVEEKFMYAEAMVHDQNVENRTFRENTVFF